MEWICQDLVSKYFETFVQGPIEYPLSTQHLSKMIEWKTEDFDSSRDLSFVGKEVEGITEFTLNRRPRVAISQELSAPTLSNRLRMTLAHELGHVEFHAVLYQLDAGIELFDRLSNNAPIYCKRETISRGGDWMEWQAAFAGGAILMPKDRLSSTVLVACENQGLKLPLRPESVEAKRLETMVAEAYVTSSEAARVRLLQNGFIEMPSVKSLEL